MQVAGVAPALPESTPPRDVNPLKGESPEPKVKFSTQTQNRKGTVMSDPQSIDHSERHGGATPAEAEELAPSFDPADNPSNPDLVGPSDEELEESDEPDPDGAPEEEADHQRGL